MIEELPESEKTPVTIITGFLGSGKTTLVNYILKEQTKWKICVVENEFGEVQIDGDLVEENLAAKEDIITMDNGCICCSIRGDLVRTFAMIEPRRKEFDAIIIETTGLADPSPIVFTFNSNTSMQNSYKIDSVVCLVDAKHIGIHLDDKKPDGNINEAEHQIAFADRIIMNKLDLVSEDEADEVYDRIRAINSFAHVIKTQKSRAPLDEILGLNSFSLDKMIEIDPSFMDDEDDGHDHEGHVHDEHCGHHVHDEHCSHEHKEHVHDEHCSHEHKEHVHDEHCSHEHKEHVHDEHCSHEHKEHEHNDHSHGHEHKKKKKKVHNLSLVSSVGYTIDGDLDTILFNEFMTSFLKEKSNDLYRSKGVLSFNREEHGDTRFVFQGVHEQINFGPADKPFQAGEPRISKMVFIGKNLDVESIKNSLQKCTVDTNKAVITMHKRA